MAAPLAIAAAAAGRTRYGRAAIAAAAALVAGAGTLAMMGLAVLFGAPGPEPGVGTVRYGASAHALRDIPAAYLAEYQAAAERHRLDWAVLAAIGKVETDHGRLNAPGVRSGENAAGAGGPMQFLAATWAAYGGDGDGDDVRDRYDPADAIPAAARYLSASGAPEDYPRAIFAYNHAQWYVDRVLEQADRYRGDFRGVDTTAVAGDLAQLDAGGLAHPPADAPAAVRRMIAAGNEIGDRPYLYGGGHPDFLAAWELDCSSSTSYLLHVGGLLGPSALVSGDLAHWGEPGPGRWVTIYANGDHVFTEIAGLRNDTGRYDTGPNAAEAGPRWRLGRRPQANFAIRHPPGL